MAVDDNGGIVMVVSAKAVVSFVTVVFSGTAAIVSCGTTVVIGGMVVVNGTTVVDPGMAVATSVTDGVPVVVSGC